MDQQISGNTEGLRAFDLECLQALYNLEIDKDVICEPEVLQQLANYSSKFNREIAIYVDRKGKIRQIAVGDHATVGLQHVNLKRGTGLTGVRLIHTHPSGDARLSSVDIAALKQLKFDLIMSVGVRAGNVTGVMFAVLNFEKQNLQAEMSSVLSLGELTRISFPKLLATIVNRKAASEFDSEQQAERALLVGVDFGIQNDYSVQDSLVELKELVQAAGVEVVDMTTQKRPKPDVRYFIGEGKAKEIGLLVQSLEANVVVFDDELTPIQLRNLEHILGIKVVDRTTIILDIFAARARSKEGKLQVELAQLKYLLPRLTGRGIDMSRLGGGIGTKGPGETKLEMDRRRIRKRVTDLERQIAEVSSKRSLQRRPREQMGLPVISLVGYTNAGKSQLLNRLAGSEVFSANMLFATLDPTIRQISLPDNRDALLIDTVGFIRKLPHHLVAAFKATLEETLAADLLLHTVDVSNPNYAHQIKAVNTILSELGAGNIRTILVYNKIDLVKDTDSLPLHMGEMCHVCVSALTGYNLDELLQDVVRSLPDAGEKLTVVIPYSEPKLLAQLHAVAKVLEQTYTDAGTQLTVFLPTSYKYLLKDYL